MPLPYELLGPVGDLEQCVVVLTIDVHESERNPVGPQGSVYSLVVARVEIWRQEPNLPDGSRTVVVLGDGDEYT